MKVQRHLEEHLKQVEEQEAAELALHGEEALFALADAKAAEAAAEALAVVQAQSTGQLALPVLKVARQQAPPDFQEQRTTLTGGWRQVLDPIWKRPFFFHPTSGRATFGLTEVLKTGGLDDLLLNRCWELCCIDPLAMEVMKDDTWTLDVYANPSLSGEPIARIHKGQLITCQIFDPKTAIATVLLPPASQGAEAGSGYVEYCLRDGRPLLKAMLPSCIEEEDVPMIDGQLRPGGDPPDGEVLAGPFFAQPPSYMTEIRVTVGQDVGSDKWAQLPRGYMVRGFTEVIGLRARLPDLEGGGWVSLCTSEGFPLFRKNPAQAPSLEVPKQKKYKESLLPVVWPGKGVIWPDAEPVVPPIPVQLPLPEMLRTLSGGRTLCDWIRMNLPPSPDFVYKSRHCPAQTTLDDLLKLQIWKMAVVEADWLHVREHEDSRSRQLFSLPRGAITVIEWVSPSGNFRLLFPSSTNDPKPVHGWADLGNADGASVVLLTAGRDFWMEPKGGHLPDDDQMDENYFKPTEMPLRREVVSDSPQSGWLQRGDGLQIAELVGRRARVIHTKCIVNHDTAPEGGWVDIIDESGWSILKARRDGEIHGEETRRAALEHHDEDHVRPGSQQKMKAVGDDISVYDEDAPADLPALLREIGELESKSIYTRDWREAIDPVWGRRYFVNKWSGQVIHNLECMGVAIAGVIITLWFSELSMEHMRVALDVPLVNVLWELEECFRDSLAALADVPEDIVSVKFLEGPDPEADGSQAEVDSIMGDSSGLVSPDQGFRIRATLRAPGVKASWASASLREAMADTERFTSTVVTMLGSVPKVSMMLPNILSSFTLLRADLEEEDIPRHAPCLSPTPPPPPWVDNRPDEEFQIVKRDLRWSKPTIVSYPFRKLGENNCRALAQALEISQEVNQEAHMEEMSLWCCSISNAGAAALAAAFSVGCGQKLQSLMLDDNDITASGATALGAGLAFCPVLRELALLGSA
ncbi:unnamed protein product [Polarella glacialis]|uniref:Uncharacterized protein n=1 Tax=Polarella glacialis TaxID=89957 RepID=A0A813KZN2_POLGL|nr:unnamed protein product [Polarella glacialis]